MSDMHDGLRSSTKRVRGLGSAHHGVGHWWLQRITALALIPLSVWFMSQLATLLMGASSGTVRYWFKSPAITIAMLLFVVALFTHARLGVQVIIEDYVHCKVKKIALLLFTNTAMLLAGLACVFSILRLHFVGI